jgi:hypothetical protein
MVRIFIAQDGLGSCFARHPPWPLNNQLPAGPAAPAALDLVLKLSSINITDSDAAEDGGYYLDESS